MMDTVSAEEALPDAATGDWRARLDLHARENWSLYQRHPWILQISGVRTWLGPNELAHYEAALASVAGLGLSGREMVSVISLVSGYVNGAARAAAEAAQQTGEADDEWWAARAPLLEKYNDPERYPTAVAVHTMGGFEQSSNDHEYLTQSAMDDFEFGLQRVLNGIKTFVQRRQAERPGR